MEAPTRHLPTIRDIRSSSVPSSVLNAGLNYLRHIYNPHVRGSRRIGHTVPSEGSALEEHLTSIRLDPFERSYSVQWITALIVQLQTIPSDDGALVEDAASLLALLAGTAAAGVVRRTFVFDCRGTDNTASPFQIKVDLRDVPLENQDFASVGSQTWGASFVLTEQITQSPHRFVPHNILQGRPECHPFRVLELGAGTGLVSLATMKTIVHLVPSDSPVQVQMVATDFFPSVLNNLAYNISQNRDENASFLSIHSEHLDWARSPPNLEPFDLILGADIVYEKNHAIWIKQVLSTLLRKLGPSSLLPPSFHLIIPLRETFRHESGTIEDVFAFEDQPRPTDTDRDLCIHSKETIICEAEDGRQDEVVEYAYYCIRWAGVQHKK